MWFEGFSLGFGIWVCGVSGVRGEGCERFGVLVCLRGLGVGVAEVWGLGST